MSTVLFTTPESARTADPAARRHGRALRTITAVAAGAVVVTALVSGQPVAAEAAALPADGAGTVLSESPTVAARAAFAALPNREQVRIAQILKNLAQGVMTEADGADDAAPVEELLYPVALAKKAWIEAAER